MHTSKLKHSILCIYQTGPLQTTTASSDNGGEASLIAALVASVGATVAITVCAVVVIVLILLLR